jgi:hypothetical protein
MRTFRSPGQWHIRVFTTRQEDEPTGADAVLWR